MNESYTYNDDVMLTTIDNPFDPFEQYQMWYNYDIQVGYNTCSYLARLTKLGRAQSDHEQQVSIIQTMEEIVKYNPMYAIVKRGDIIPSKKSS